MLLLRRSNAKSNMIRDSPPRDSAVFLPFDLDPVWRFEHRNLAALSRFRSGFEGAHAKMKRGESYSAAKLLMWMHLD